MTPAQIASIHAACFPERPWSEAELSELISQSGAVCLTEQDAGFALARQTLDEAELLTIAVLPRAQGKGVGLALLEQMGQRLGAAGATRLFLEVSTDNSAARALYAKAGFEQVGLRKAYYARKGSTASDALILEKKLMA